MQQDNNNMDKRLSQIENQSLPDLSKMDKHWDEMKNSLQTGDSFPKTKPSKRVFRWIVSASLAGIAFFITYHFVFKKNDTNITLQKTEPALYSNTSTDTLPTIKFIPGKETSTVIGKDTIRINPLEAKTSAKEFIVKAKTTDGKDVELKWTAVSGSGKKTLDTVSFKPQKEQPASKPILLKGKTTDGKEIEVLATPVNDTTNKKPDVDKKKTLQDFFAQLEKESQSFVINNKVDTVIRGNQGTALLIPANAFGTNEPVKITMREFYSYEDIITNRLTTVSDGKLLETGGMLHLKATVNGREIDLAQGKSIRWFAIDTTRSEMQDMRLFNGVVNNNPSIYLNRVNEVRDTVAVDFPSSSNNINWVAQPGSFTDNYFYVNVRVLDLRDRPYNYRETKKGRIGKFYIAPDAKISKQELENYLITKRGYYKVQIKEREEGVRRKGLSRWSTYEVDLGDSTWMDISDARRFGLTPTDTIVTTTRIKGWYDFDVYVGFRKKMVYEFDTVFSKTNLKDLANRYSIDIATLGWVNCDRFLRDSRPKIDYIVQINEPATDYYTVLVFENMKSMMQGNAEGNKIVFRNVPEGEQVKVLSFGVSSGKPVAAMETVKLSRNIFSGLRFEGTTPTEFKEKAGTLDKP